MSIQTNDTTTPPEATPPEATSPDLPAETDRQIQINWIITARGLGGVAAVGTLLPELL